jgi:two-component system NarL family response regulator
MKDVLSASDYIAAQNQAMLEGLQNLLEAHNYEVIGLAKNGLEATNLAQKLQPEVILMDIRMPDLDGLAATRLIKAQMPEMKIIILTTSTDDHDLFEAVKSGACGYLLKSMDSSELIESLDQVQEGIPPFSPGLAAKIMAESFRLSRPAEPILPTGQAESPAVRPEKKLTPRQIEVLGLITQGFSYKEGGARLDLSPRTIKYHMAEIMQQLYLQNRAQVMAYAVSLGGKNNPPTKLG